MDYETAAFQDTIGSNGFFQVKPSVLNFAGYQVRKTQTRKILVKNIANTAQRVSILPTNTPYFKVKFNKRGLLAPGMSQILFIQFTPPQWRYYYDCVRILSAGGNLNVPVHAYPVLNNKQRYIPSVLDLGKCYIGERLQQSVQLQSTVPVEFEFQVKQVTSHPDISVSPIFGDIPGNSVVEIQVVYQPSSASTAIAMFELRLSEFDYTPCSMKVIASSSHQPSDLSFAYIEDSPSRTLLGSKELERPRRLPQLSKTSKSIGKTEVLKPKSIDRVIYQQQFTAEFRIIETTDREKEFKIYSSRGNPHPDQEFIEKVQIQRLKLKQRVEENQRSKDCHRIEKETDRDKIIADEEFFSQIQPSWDVYQNDDFLLRELTLKRLFDAATTVQIRLRVDKRLGMIKARLAQHNVKNKEDAKKFVAWDWKQAQILGIGVQDFIPFEFSISPPEIQLTKFPQDFQAHMEQFSKKVQVTPMQKFITVHPLNFIQPQDFQMASYNDFVPPCVSHYLPADQKLPRQGAEQEFAVVLPKGEAKQDLLTEISSVFYKPSAVDPISLIRPHPVFRPYLRLKGVTECSVQYQFQSNFQPTSGFVEYPGYFQPSANYHLSNWKPIVDYKQIEPPSDMKGPRQAELLSDSDSESENVFNIEIPDFQGYFMAFDDSEIKEPQLPLRVRSQQEWCEKSLFDRKSVVAWQPTMLTRANRSINSPENKLSLR